MEGVINRITRAECERLVVGVHYAHRWTSKFMKIVVASYDVA